MIKNNFQISILGALINKATGQDFLVSNSIKSLFMTIDEIKSIVDEEDKALKVKYLVLDMALCYYNIMFASARPWLSKFSDLSDESGLFAIKAKRFNEMEKRIIATKFVKMSSEERKFKLWLLLDTFKNYMEMQSPLEAMEPLAKLLVWLEIVEEDYLGWDGDALYATQFTSSILDLIIKSETLSDVEFCHQTFVTDDNPSFKQKHAIKLFHAIHSALEYTIQETDEDFQHRDFVETYVAIVPALLEAETIDEHSPNKKLFHAINELYDSRISREELFEMFELYQDINVAEWLSKS